MLFTKVSRALNSVFFIQNSSIRYCLYKRSHVGMKTLKKLTTSLFVKDLISTFFLTVLRFLRKLFLRSKTSKYEIFCFETKISIKKHVFWSKKICRIRHRIVSNSAPADLKLTSSLNNFKRKLKIYFLRNSKTWNKMSLLVDTVLGASTVKFSNNCN